MGGALARQVSELSAADCAGASRAFAVCRVHDERLFGALASRLRDAEVRAALSPEELGQVLYGFAKFTSQDVALLDMLAIEARRRLHLMDASLLSSTLASLAKAGITSPVLTNRAAQLLRRQAASPKAGKAEGEFAEDFNTLREQPAPACNLDSATVRELSALSMAFSKLQVCDRKLFDRLAEALLRSGTAGGRPPAILAEPGATLVNIVHAFTKVHQAPQKLFGLITRTLVQRPEQDLSARDAVKLLHALAKVDHLLLPALRERLELALRPERLGELGVFELLKLAAATRRLGLQLPELEAQVSHVLPNEPKDSRAERIPQRRPASAKRRKQSARKRKWAW
eukprot:TRINITY_DN48870_c0_g1_i1.p1 TRINITY_DN48870_c0_g1~~TRINITY_DN48870_c0_g1_i1.p1  ORF type:complete len:342 (-),score=85.84 TRINITY_DN48870_c0_g1_i1:4-1029(-)